MDYRTEAQKETEDDYQQKPRMAINSDTEEEDSSEDEEMKMAKASVYSRDIMRNRGIPMEESESDY